MVDGQIRTADVTDPALIFALRSVPREGFVPAALRSLAYMGEGVEAAPGRQLMDPRVFAKLVIAADVRATDKVLDVGGGTGYSAAILARLAADVVALEEPLLAPIAREHLAATGVQGVEVVAGPLNQGWAGAAPYDVIFLNGAIAVQPEALLAQLAPGGRLVGIVTDKAAGKAHIFVKSVAGVSSRIAFDASVAPLPGFAAAPHFAF
ncbi:MAG: protein-L-isoaspartate O-methyltransferase [Alphaproteobacteria bacterium]|nr:protein-L-isoaspartate O-methyltransferase [Alphaproteobacteria bacterium]